MDYNTLVRDKVPQILEKNGKTCIYDEMDNDLFEQKILEKLDLEYKDFLKQFHNFNDEQAIKKLADLVEVIYAIVDFIGVDRNAFDKIRQVKANDNGSYNKKILLKQVLD